MNTDKSSFDVSLVISTLGRNSQLFRLFESLAKQDFQNFEVVVVDQNKDDLLADLFARQWPFNVTRLQTPDRRGISLGRNIGWKASTGSAVVFPDDDCWYPTWFLAHTVRRMAELDADFLSGRAADEAGESINGRYALSLHRIDRSNVWISGIEWAATFKRDVLESTGGFDENLGIGANSPWQAGEGQEIMLRALAKGFKGYFDPSLYGHHEKFDISAMVGPMAHKGRGYGRGMGYVLRTHHYGPTDTAKWIIRPLGRAGLDLLRGNPRSSGYGLNVALGRLEGVLGRTYSFRL